jgi:hypothetical protein
MTGARSSRLLLWVCVLHVLVAAPGCGNRNRFDLSAIEDWCYVDEKVHLIWCRREGVDLVEPGSSNHRMLHTRVRYDEIRYAIPHGQQRGVILPGLVQGLSDDSSTGVQQKSPAELLGMIGVDLPPLAFDTRALSPEQRGTVDAWLAARGYPASSVVLWSSEDTRETWVLGGTTAGTGVLNIETGFQAATPAPYIDSFWSPRDGVVAFTECAATRRIRGFPYRLVLWDYCNGMQSEFELVPPDIKEDR